jgi:error-prone DNA polymerase
MTERYIELHSSSAFSFLEGASQPEELIKRAVELEMTAMALLDRNGVYGSARFHTSEKFLRPLMLEVYLIGFVTSTSVL